MLVLRHHCTRDAGGAISDPRIDREYVEAGGLMSYGTSLPDFTVSWRLYRPHPRYKPVDLPVLQSVKFELVINLETARMLGLDVPPSLIAEANEVME